MEEIGTVHALWRYPVKSMAGERLPEAPLTLQGFAGDRHYAFVKKGARGSFPWLTGRDHADMLRYTPAWTDDDPPRLRVRTPDGRDVAIEDDALRAELEAASGKPSYLLADYRGNYDVAAVSLITLPTVTRLAEASDTPADPRRFRMNFYVETGDGEPFTERAWVGRVLRIGDTARIAVTQPDQRCAMITLHPDSAEAAPRVLRAAAQLNDACAGVYAFVLSTGPVRAGDPVRLEG